MMEANQVFEKYKKIGNLINNKEEAEARNALFKFLDEWGDREYLYPTILNSLFRELGLYPYMTGSLEDTHWSDQYAYEAFKVPVGLEEPKVLHLEQSGVLKKLLEGKNIAVSAPTSFGKSFIIDAYIAIKKPKNVLIIVPTIALADEARRRITQKFGDDYKVITTAYAELENRNVFILTPERALLYKSIIIQLDVLIIDEFYKIHSDFDSRSIILNHALVCFYGKAKQVYFLAPNIKKLKIENTYIFHENIEFISLDFNTVFLNIIDKSKSFILPEEKIKEVEKIIHKNDKSLIYFGEIRELLSTANKFTELDVKESSILIEFSQWLKINYSEDWFFPELINRGIGVHNGRLHRSLTQIQIKLFNNSNNGFNTLLTTSSLIEGVNTSARNVVLWNTTIAGNPLNSFTYKNILGRSGRMFQYFVGNVYVFGRPPEDENVELLVEFPDELLGIVDPEESILDLPREKINTIKERREKFAEILGGNDLLQELIEEESLQLPNIENHIKITQAIVDNPKTWNGLYYLTLDDPESWRVMLRQVIYLDLINTNFPKHAYVDYVIYLSQSWIKPLKEILEDLNDKKFDDEIEITIDDYFRLERNVSFELSRVLNDVVVIYNKIAKGQKKKQYNVFPLINKIKNGFLPPLVYLLEEYGLPRMISKKIDNSKIINLSKNEGCDLHETLQEFKSLGIETLISKVSDLDEFDKKIIKYFYSGI